MEVSLSQSQLLVPLPLLSILIWLWFLVCLLFPMRKDIAQKTWPTTVSMPLHFQASRINNPKQNITITSPRLLFLLLLLLCKPSYLCYSVVSIESGPLCWVDSTIDPPFPKPRLWRRRWELRVHRQGNHVLDSVAIRPPTTQSFWWMVFRETFYSKDRSA